jgi:glycosyltransferase involved in cell wall biosynthesis
MRVLLCIDSLGVGGKERQAVELARGLASAPGVSCRVTCFDQATFYRSDLPDIPVDTLARRSRWDPALFRGLRTICDDFRPDVIHTNGLVSSFYALPIARRLGIPLINGSIRNAFTARDLRWRIERYLLLLSDVRVSNSRAGLESRGFQVSDPRNAVIHNGYDVDRLLNATGAPSATPLDPATKKVGMVAEFNPYKDYGTFVDAARMICAARHDVDFLAVGGGANLEHHRGSAADLTRVHFLGERKDVASVVRTFDVGVLCSFSEGISNSVMEYMALGRPVVATDSGGTRELVVHGETGLLVAPRKPEEVASAVTYLLDHPDDASRMGAAGQRRLQREFSFARMVGDVLELYERVLHRGTVAATA